MTVGSKQWDGDVNDAFRVLTIALPIPIFTNAAESRFQFRMGDRCFSFYGLMSREELRPVLRCLKRQEHVS